MTNGNKRKVEKTIGQFIRERRGNLSIHKLAKLSGVSASEICRIETGVRPTSKIQTLKKILDALQVPFDEFIREIGYINSDPADPAVRLVEEKLAKFPRLKLTAQEKAKIVEIVMKHLKTTIPSLVESLESLKEVG